jgi:hypothetical protein
MPAAFAAVAIKSCVRHLGPRLAKSGNRLVAARLVDTECVSSCDAVFAPGIFNPPPGERMPCRGRLQGRR